MVQERLHVRVETKVESKKDLCAQYIIQRKTDHSARHQAIVFFSMVKPLKYFT